MRNLDINAHGVTEVQLSEEVFDSGTAIVRLVIKGVGYAEGTSGPMALCLFLDEDVSFKDLWNVAKAPSLSKAGRMYQDLEDYVRRGMFEDAGNLLAHILVEAHGEVTDDQLCELTHALAGELGLA